MVKSLTAFAVFALLGASVVALLGFAPLKANETAALAKADRLNIKPAAAICSQQVWPHFDAACLRGGDTASFREVRLVTARR